jgi:hypothetical protein
MLEKKCTAEVPDREPLLLGPRNTRRQIVVYVMR